MEALISAYASRGSKGRTNETKVTFVLMTRHVNGYTILQILRNTTPTIIILETRMLMMIVLILEAIGQLSGNLLMLR